MSTVLIFAGLAAVCGISWVIGFVMGDTQGYARGKLRGHAEAKSPTVIHEWPVPPNFQNPMGGKKDDV